MSYSNPRRPRDFTNPRLQTPPAPQRACAPYHRGSSLDELPEFSQRVLEPLRQPLEDGIVVVLRAAGSAAFPARFQLVGAANPCRRGCASLEACVCTAGEKHAADSWPLGLGDLAAEVLRRPRGTGPVGVNFLLCTPGGAGEAREWPPVVSQPTAGAGPGQGGNA